MADWARIRQSLGRAYDDIHSNPIASAAVSTALSAVPVLGDFLERVYENSPGSSEDKGSDVLQLLQNLQRLDDERLRQMTEAFQKNQQMLLANHDALAKLVASSDQVDSKLDQMRSGQLTLEEGNKRVQEEIQGLSGQNAKVLQELDADREEVHEIHADVTDLKKTLSLFAPSSATNAATSTDAGTGQSETDGLLKQANLLTVEAGERMTDALRLNGEKFQAEVQAAVAAGNTVDQVLYKYFELLGEYIDPESRAKPAQAMSLIQKAERGDPSNVDALLQDVQLRYLLDPADKDARWRLMNRAVGLLGAPSDDRRRLQVAFATYFRAIDSQPVDMASVGMARTMFQDLGRNEYVQQIDSLMGSAQATAAAASPAVAGPVGSFPNFAGRWSIQFDDGESDVLEMYPNGTFQGAAQQGGVQHNVAGQWAFQAFTGTLGLQGFVDVYLPFESQLIIRGEQENAFSGVDAKGSTFFMRRV